MLELKKNESSSSCFSAHMEVVLDNDKDGDKVLGGQVLPYDVSNEDQLDQYPAAGRPAKTISEIPLWKRMFWEGGRPFDAFLTIISAQVGQVILNLPNSMSKAGLPLGTIFQLWAAITTVYTLWLLSTLYQEYKRKSIKDETWFNDERGEVRTRVTQFHDVIGAATGRRWLREFARAVTVVELIGLCVAQVIASSSNLYSLYPGLPKRTWAFVTGSICSLMVLVPSMRNMRLFSLFTLFTTTFTALYMSAVSLSSGLRADAAAQPPRGPSDVFSALANTIFAFGGHCMLLEVLDSQWRPSKFSKSFAWSQVYVTGLLTWPNAAFTFLAFPEATYKFGNAFAVYPASSWKSAAIVTMVVDQVTAYGLFVNPLCTMWEKMLRIHHRPNIIRLPARIPVALLVWLIALAIPFFGVINDLMGAFCVTFETFILPPLAFNLYYQNRPDRQAAAYINDKQRRWFGGWPGMFILNWLIVCTTLVVGLGAGGYASVRGLVASIDKYRFFAACYNC